MFGLGTTEILIILAVLTVLFGASRLPGLGKSLGSGLRGFRDALVGKQDDVPDADSQVPAPRS